MAKIIAPSENLGKRSFTGLSVYESARLLRRYQQVERACMKVALAWLLAAPKYEDKYAIGYHLWDHAEHVQWLRTRLEELRGGNVDAAVEPLLKVALDENLHARDMAELAAGLYLGLKQALLDAYREHLRFADSAANAAESRLLARMIPDLERQIVWAEGIVSRPESNRQAANHWQMYIVALLEQAGGIGGMSYTISDSPPSRPHPFRMPRPDQMIFDERIQIGQLASYQSREGLPIDEAVREQFKVFFNEWWAAGLLATILYDAWDSDAPWEFFYELSHHCWDEVRHSEFGAIRLRELGDEPRNVDMSLFTQAVNWPFLHRLIYLTLDMEVYFMARKRPRVLRYQEEQENRSLIFADADWSDEINHVRYGKRWSDFLLKDDMRTVDDIKQEIAALIERQNQQTQDETKSPF